MPERVSAQTHRTIGGDAYNRHPPIFLKSWLDALPKTRSGAYSAAATPGGAERRVNRNCVFLRGSTAPPGAEGTPD